MHSSIPTVLYPLTSPQREIWFDQMLHEGVPLYNIGGYAKLLGSIDIHLFQQATNLLIKKHDALRMVLSEETDEDGIPLQGYAKELTVKVAMQDFSATAQPHENAMAWMQQRFIVPFSLKGQPLFRYDLIKISDDCYYWLLQYHHLMIDGYGAALLNRSIAAIYTELSEGKTPHLNSPSYTHFVENDRIYIKSPLFAKQKQYWLAQFATPPEPLLAPRYHVHDINGLVGSDCEVLYLSRDFYQRLGELAKQHSATLFHVLLGALTVYFTRITGQDDVVIGLPVLNRSNAQFKQTAGLFTGVSPTLFNFDKNLCFAELLQNINKTLKANYRHQRFPVSEINRAVGLGRERSQLFDVNLSYESHDNTMSFNGIKGQLIPLLHNYEQTPLTIFVRDFHTEHDVEFNFVFNCAYFNTEDVKALQARFVTILEAVLQDSSAPMHTLPVMTETEKNQLIAWNDTTTDYPQDKTIVDLFEQQVEQTPNHIAVVFEDEILTYQQLNTKANQLAHYLIQLKQQTPLPDNPLIAIAVDRSTEMVIGLLGILKAGGAYVPIDPSYPTARIEHMLADSAAPIVLTQSILKAQLPLDGLMHACQAICLDEMQCDAQPTENLDISGKVNDLAYIIYTSGSTGKPKGVMVEHTGLVNLALAQINGFALSEASHLLQFASISFDASVSEVVTTLLTGATLHVAPKAKLLETSDLVVFMAAQQISHVTFPPSFLQQLPPQLPSTLKTIAVAGEACPQALLSQWASQVHLVNAYGPTESTVCASMTGGLLENESPHIGQPLSNTRIYILDAQHQPQPLNIPGELCIAGAGLARGYLNRPELTAEKFIEVDLFGKRERIYKTGDLARWLPDGNLEYLGRIDHQVKLRGFRIELGEIEAVLMQHEAVKESAVIVPQTENSQQLVAYITLRQIIETAELRHWLKTHLPDYMVPAHFQILDALPLTPNGKIDRKCLEKQADKTHPAINTVGYVAPRNYQEELLVNIWIAVLKVEKIGVYDNFFELGGHSLLATQVTTRIRETFEVKIPVRSLFEYPIVSDLAEYLDLMQPAKPNSPLEQGEEEFEL